MPKGLPDVTQKFDADASGYHGEFLRMLADNRELVSSIREVRRELGQFEDQAKVFAPFSREARDAIASAQLYRVALEQAGAAGEDFNVSVQKMTEGLSSYGAMMEEAAARNRDFRDTQVESERITGEHANALERLATAYDLSFAAAHRRTAEQRQIIKSFMDEASTVDQLVSKYGLAKKVQEEWAVSSARIAQQTQYTAEHMATLNQTLRDTVELGGAIRYIGDAAGIASALKDRGAVYSGGVYSGATDAAAVEAAAARAEAAAMTSAPPGEGLRAARAARAAVIEEARKARERASSDAAAIADAIAVSGGGGSFGGGGPRTSFGTGPFERGTAGADAAAIVGFVRRWWGAVHWTIMGVNETLATVGPALAAAGSAALVGMQAAEHMSVRYQAITTTAEALGTVPGFGQTAGQFISGKNTLQQMQNLAEGGYYQLPGAFINMLRGGAGAPFLQQGVSTIAMIDRGLAAATLNAQARGTAGALAQVLGGGTDYLRAFGDIGGNVGNIFMGLAPHLPGVGADYLSVLKGITGGLAGGIGLLNQAGLGDILGGGLAFEAGWRVGRPLLGLLGRGIGVAGRGLYGLGGTMARAGLASDALVSEGGLGSRLLFGTGLRLSALGEGLGGAADILGAVTGPVAGIGAVDAFLISKLLSASVAPQSRLISGLQAQIGQAGYTGAWQPLAKAITQVTGLAQLAPGLPGVGATQPSFTISRFGPMGETAQQILQQGAQGFAGQMTDLLRSGPQLMQILQGMGMHGVTMGQAFQVAQNSLLDLNHAFDKNGKLTSVAQQMMKNYLATLAPMTQNVGGFGAAIAAQTILGSPQMQNLSKVNQAMDSMTQIMTGGPAGMAGLFGLLGGTPVTAGSAPRRAGIRLAAPPAFSKMAAALTSFTTSQGAAAWNAFIGSTAQPGFILSEQQNLDQLRTAMSLGALSEPQAQGLAGFQLEQLLPMARKSPAALAMVMQQAAQMGIGGYYQQGLSQQQNYQNAVNAVGKIADSSKQANQATNQMSVNLSRLPQLAQQFVKGMNADVMTQQVAQTATAMDNVITKAGKGKVDTAGLQQIVTNLQHAGVSAQALGPIIQNALQQAGVSGAMAKKIMLQVQVDVGGAQQKINSIQGKTVDVKVQSDVAKVQAAVNAIQGKTVTVTVIQHFTTSGTPIVGLGSVRTISGTGQLGSLGGRTGAQTGMLVPGSGGGDSFPAMLEPGEAVVPKHLVGAVAPFLAANKVPGFASGGIAGGISLPGLDLMIRDIADGIITPVVTDLMHSMADILSRASSSFMVHAYGGAGGSGSGIPRQGPPPGIPGPFPVSGPTMPAQSPAAAKQEAAYAKSVTAAAISGFSLSGIDTSTATVVDSMQQYVDSLKSFASDVKTLGAEGLNKTLLKQLIAAGPVTGDQLAKSILGGMKSQIAQQQVAGLNLGGMDVTPGTGQGTVQEQMQSYLQSMQSFAGDFKTLSKGGLSKQMLQQIMAAGPVQGDALAQSILSGPGGIKGANQLWQQINAEAQSIGGIGAGALGGMGVGNVNKLWQQISAGASGLGAAAAQAVFGFPLHGKTVKAGVTADLAPVHQLQSAIDSLHGKTITIHVNVTSGGGSGGGDRLSPQQITQLAQEFQKQMLKQARRNPGTGLKLQDKRT